MKSRRTAKNQNTDIPSKVEGLLRITAHGTFSKAWNTSVFIVSRLFLISIKFVKMSWIKANAKAGLSGLTPFEAAWEALFNPNLQSVPDPLEPLVKELNVSTLYV